MPKVTWIARDEEGRLVEVQAEIVNSEELGELTEPAPEEEP